MYVTVDYCIFYMSQLNRITKVLVAILWRSEKI